MANTFLSFGLDPALLDQESAVFARQRAYFQGLEATIILLSAGEEATTQEEGVRVVRAGGSSKVGRFWRAFQLAWRHAPVDVVISQDAGPMGWLAYASAKKMRAKLFLQDHAGLFARPAFGWRERLLRPLAAYLFRRADQVRAVSTRAKRGLLRIGVEERRIRVFPIRNGLSPFLSVVSRPGPTPTIVCVARLEAEKGVDVLLRAMVCVPSSPRLVIVGTGSKREALMKMAKELGLQDRVTFAGKKTAAEIAAFFSTAWAYVQPSFFEGWGMAVVEAAAAALPIVMTDVGCAGELLFEGDSARIVPVGSPEALAEALTWVLDHPEEALAMGRRARRAVEKLPGPQGGTEEMRAWIGIEGA